MMVNGVEVAAIPDASGPTAALLIPGDVNQTLPNVHNMNLVGRNVATSLGLPSDPKAVPLAVGTGLRQEFNDQVNGAKHQVIAQANLELQSFKDQAQGFAGQQRDQLLADIQRQLDLGPFKLAGDANVTANNDGTATISVQAQLPGLTGVDDSPLRVGVTINGDLQGHLHLQGIHLSADKAFLFHSRAWPRSIWDRSLPRPILARRSVTRTTSSGSTPPARSARSSRTRACTWSFPMPAWRAAERSTSISRSSTV